MSLGQLEQKERDLLTRRSEIHEASTEVDGEARRAQDRLRQLANQWALTLAKHRLGEIPDEDFSAREAEMDPLSKVIGRAPKLLEGLKVLEVELEKKLQTVTKAIAREKTLEQYHEKILQIQEEGWNRDLESAIWGLASDLGKRKEAEPIITEALRKAQVLDTWENAT